MDAIRINSPLDEATVGKLKSGDRVLITGVIYVARDAAHKRIVEALDKGNPLPFDIRGATVYYMGPSPARPGKPIGAAGPTTSGRMDACTPRLIAEGLRAMIGKGMRSPAVKNAIRKHKAVYFSAIGGTGALISKSVKKSEIIAYE
jgi:fumarate hydratase subunit beta